MLPKTHLLRIPDEETGRGPVSSPMSLCTRGSSGYAGGGGVNGREIAKVEYTGFDS